MLGSFGFFGFLEGCFIRKYRRLTASSLGEKGSNILVISIVFGWTFPLT